MRTRLAKYSDLKAVVAYLKKMHETTDWEFVPFDEKLVRQNVVAMIRTQDIMDVIIAERKGRICGVVLVTLDTFFWAKKRYASSVHFVADGGGPALLGMYKRWADERDCSYIIEAVATHDAKAERFFLASGFKRKGGTMVCALEQVKEQAA